MRVIRGIHNIPPNWGGCVAAVGNFDGVHRGHQAVLQQLQQQAARLKLPSLAVCFEPYPAEFFSEDDPPARITNLREKILALTATGLEYLVVLRFNQKLAQVSAEHFITEYLIKSLKIRGIIVGDDFRFGASRRGDVGMLRTFAPSANYDVFQANSFLDAGERVSSTLVRRLLTAADLAAVEHKLGRQYSISGRILLGDQRGRELGYPTANVRVKRLKLPMTGVFTVKVCGIAQQPLPGVANMGHRPTVDGLRNSLEVHLLDFDQSIYGRYVNVVFCSKLRDEKRFSSLDELTQQIGLDAQQAREYFGLTAQK